MYILFNNNGVLTWTAADLYWKIDILSHGANPAEKKWN